MVGTFIARWMTIGVVMFVVSRIIRFIILWDILNDSKKIRKISKEDYTQREADNLAYGGGFLQFIVVLLIGEIAIWPVSAPFSIYHALQLRDQYSK